MLDVRDRQVVIVGGGAVAARKARRLLQAGATRVKVVATAFDPSMPQGVQRIDATYDSTHLDGAQLVYAATDSAEVNAAVVRDARQRGAWVNRVDEDDDGGGDFAVPASSEQGALRIAVGCGSPAVSRWIRRKIEAALDPRLGDYAAAAVRVREMVLADASLSAEQRREILLHLGSDAAFEAFANGGIEGLVASAQRMCPQWKPVLPG